MNGYWLIMRFILGLVSLTLPAIVFAWRGIALLRMRFVEKNRMTSLSGFAAMLALLWLFSVSPIAVYQFRDIFDDFDLDLPAVTVMTISLAEWHFTYGMIFWWAIGPGLLVCALTVPEILFYQPQPGYSGFWKRLMARAIDALVLSAWSVPTVFFLFATDASLLLWCLALVIDVVLSWLYFSCFESSRLQATPGKLLMKISVCDLSKQQLTLLRATGTHFGKLISALPLGIGFVMAAFSPRKQALHDIISECLVINRTEAGEHHLPQ